MTPELTPLARKLRRTATEAEQLLWRHLRARQLDGMKFRRQEQIGRYIVDFVCYEKKLVVEADGGQHAEHIETDKERSDWLKGQGFKVLRFWNHDVLTNIEGVLEHIASGSLSPSP